MMKEGKLISRDRFPFLGLVKAFLTFALAGDDDEELKLECPECGAREIYYVNIVKRNWVNCKACKNPFRF